MSTQKKHVRISKKGKPFVAGDKKEKLTWEQKNDISLAASGGSLSIDDEESSGLKSWIRKNEEKIIKCYSSFILEIKDHEEELNDVESMSDFKRKLDEVLEFSCNPHNI